jgi:transposase-like protein
MARKVNQILWDQWRQRIERQRASGLSIAEFCRKENVPRQGFHVWKRKLRPTTSAQHPLGGTARSPRSRKERAIATPHRRPRRATAKPAMPPRSAGFLQLPVTAAQGSPWIELALADGTILRLPQQNLAALITALRVLRGERLELPHEESCHA